MNIPFNTEPDDSGMVDGLSLATEMIRLAVKLINPYVYGCPDCLDNVVAAIATTALYEVHKGVEEGDAKCAAVICFADRDKADAVIQEALSAAQPRIAALVGLFSDGPPLQ